VLRTQNVGIKFKLKIGAMAKKDEIGKEENQETRNRLLDLIQIVFVPSVVKLVWIECTKAGEEKMK